MATFTYVSVADCTCNYTDNSTLTYNTTYTITVTANEGYYFDTTPYLTLPNEIGERTTVYMTSEEVTEYKTIYSATVTILSAQSVRLYAVAQIIPVLDKYGIITIYNPTISQLKDIASVRYSISEETIDLGAYITNIIKVFAPIPQGQTANVLLGGYDTDVSANVVLNDIVEVDCGAITVVGHYNNAMDYKNTVAELFLPLIGFVSVDVNKIMSQTLSLIYKINVINGDTLACLYNSNDDLIECFQSDSSFEIPYRLNDELEARGNVGVNSNYLYGFTPFLRVRYNLSYNVDNIANDNKETVLTNITGYIKCSEIYNTLAITTAEKNEIDELLRNGVIIT